MNEKHTECLRCGLKIKSTKTQEIGYGPVCLRKAAQEAKEKEEGAKGE